ncbi:MAG: T9SS type B sorting domain-containing protein, partial [Bacteroidota bacterium]
SCRDCDSPWVKPEFDVVYVVTATNENGCIATDEVRVQVVKVERVFVANAFTPNNDGANDFFFVQGGRGTERVRIFRVFDRWGENVFESRLTPLNVPEIGWDGTLNGKEMNPGVFAWYAEIEFSDGTIELFKGSVTLLR